MTIDPAHAPAAPRDEEELEEWLSRPTAGVVDALRHAPGDILVLGAGGKMGPSLTAMAHRAADAVGDGRRVFAVSRWSEAHQAARLEALGVEVIRSDLMESASIAALPDAPNVVFMVGQKFGTSSAPSLTWMTNTVVPALVAERYAGARIVAFSTGNVYPRSPVTGARPGAREGDALAPVGEYAASCVGRERVLEHASLVRGTRVALIRLNYAVDLRYGVLVDIAQKVRDGVAVDVGMGFVNCIWQGDANAFALRALPHCAAPPLLLNVTGGELLSVRAVAREFGRLLGREPRFAGTEGGDALLSDTARLHAVFGVPEVSAAELIAWVADWVGRGGRTLGKQTRFESRDGRF